MKKCMVISGQYRTFDKTWPQLKEFIDLNELDVYAHLWSNPHIGQENLRHFHEVKDRLQPKRIFQQPMQGDVVVEFDKIEERIKLANPKGPNQDKLAGNASMNYSRDAAFQMVDQEYDIVVYCRYDIGFRQMFTFENVDRIITPEEESYNLISDIFAIMPMSMAKSYFLYKDYERLHSTPWEPEFLDWLRNVKKYPEQDIQTHIQTRYCPHLMLMRNIIMNGHTYHTTNLPVYLQR